MYEMGQSSSSIAYTSLPKQEEKEDSEWKKYSQKYSTNTSSFPERDNYKRLK